MAKHQNPANETETFVIPADFVPMSLPRQKLEVPDIPGYHLHWFRGTPERLARAQQAYYEFVNPEEVGLNNFDLGGDARSSGNTDMGTRVSIVAGDDSDGSNQPARLYLMKCRQEYYEASQKVLTDRNSAIVQALTSGMVGAGQQGELQSDVGQRYVKSPLPDLFNPNKRRPLNG